MIVEERKYVIGVDGGATRTKAALAGLEGIILKSAESGSANATNIGVKRAVDNISQAIRKVLPDKGSVRSTVIGLPAVQERPKLKVEIRKELLRRRELSVLFKGKLVIVSDQLVAFRAGTDGQEGVLVVAGTGSVAHGWCKEKEVHVLGWGWLVDEGSAFFVGQKAFQAILKDLDGRGEKTILTKLVFREFKVKKVSGLIDLVYSQPINIVPRFAVICSQADKAGDKMAKAILEEAGKELALAGKTVTEKLNLQQKSFPLILAGGMFKSATISGIIRKTVKGFAPKAEIILLEDKPVSGAIKLALEQL